MAIGESLGAFGVACVEAGAAGVYFSAQGGEQGRFTAEEFERYVKPADLAALSAFKDVGEFHLLHICKDHIRLHLYADYPAHAVNWAATKNNLTLKQGRDLFKRTVVGGFGDRGLIAEGSLDEIRAHTRAIIADVGRTGLMIGADCTVPTDIDISRLRAAIEATA